MILITGAGGQLGRSFVDLLSNETEREFIAADRFALDVTLQNETQKYIEKLSPEVIVHAAAMTDVDQCETQPDLAFQVNALGSRNVAFAAHEVGASLVVLSTDYVFDGTQQGPYCEADIPNPINVYGKSKLQGEEFAKEVCEKTFIVRTAWLYSDYGQNFVQTMRELSQSGSGISVVCDQHGTPTWASDLARQILVLIESEDYGTYHTTSQGGCSWYEFAQEIFKNLKHDVVLKPVSSESFPRPARRPANCVLENRNLQCASLDVMPHWKTSLADFLTTQAKERVG